MKLKLKIKFEKQQQQKKVIIIIIIIIILAFCHMQLSQIIIAIKTQIIILTQNIIITNYSHK